MSEHTQRWIEKSGIVWKVLEDTPTYQTLEQTSLVLVYKNEYAKLKADSKRLEDLEEWLNGRIEAIPENEIEFDGVMRFGYELVREWIKGAELRQENDKLEE